MNLLTPLLDKVLKPKVFGEVQKAVSYTHLDVYKRQGKK